MAASDLLPFERMWPLVFQRLPRPESERIPVVQASGRVLTAEAVATKGLPSFDNSAMDGYAVRSSDTTKGEGTARRLVLPGVDAYAGSPAPPPLEPNTAVPIGTGGRIPQGADAVVPKENVHRRGDEVLLPARVDPGSHIRRQGEELSAGDRLCRSGEVLDPARIASLLMAGVTNVEVAHRPRVGILSTGNELVDPAQTPGSGQIVDTNGPFLWLETERLLGCSAIRHGPVRDDRNSLEASIGSVLDQVDVLVLTGGVSVGDRDLVKEILEEHFGVERLFWRVSQKPGKPVYAGMGNRRRWILGLPGNPGAVVAMWHFLVRPLLLGLMGARHPEPERIPLRLGTALRPDPKRTLLRGCRTDWFGGTRWAEPMERNGSHMLSDLARAEVIAIVPPAEEPCRTGTELEGIELR